MAHFDGAGRHGISRLQARNDFTGRIGLDGEIAVGRRSHACSDILRAAIDGVERLRERRRQTPGDLFIFLRDGWCGKNGRSGSACTGNADRREPDISLR